MRGIINNVVCRAKQQTDLNELRDSHLHINIVISYVMTLNEILWRRRRAHQIEANFYSLVPFLEF